MRITDARLLGRYPFSRCKFPDFAILSLKHTAGIGHDIDFSFFILAECHYESSYPAVRMALK
jgi:hypothetical protein